MAKNRDVTYTLKIVADGGNAKTTAESDQAEGALREHGTATLLPRGAVFQRCYG